MINDKKLNQEGGEDSTNIQAETVNITHTGLTYLDAKEIALDVFKSNFLQLSKDAADVAKERAEHLVDNFLQKLKETSPDKIENIKDPDIQYAIYTAQKECARSGEKELEEILADILIERISENTPLKKIILNESIGIISKLTNQQLDVLTLIFLIQCNTEIIISNKENLLEYLQSHYTPFIENLTKDKSCFLHLEYAGCCSTITMDLHKLSEIFLRRYRHLFSMGFSLQHFKDITNNDDSLLSLITPCLNNSDLFQLNITDNQELKDIVVNKLLKGHDIYNKISTLSRTTTMRNKDIEDELIIQIPQIKNLFDTWISSYMCAMNPTSVGIAIACFNLKQKTGIKLDLTNWIK